MPPKPDNSAVFGNFRALQLLFKVIAGENEGCSAAISGGRRIPVEFAADSCRGRGNDRGRRQTSFARRQRTEPNRGRVRGGGSSPASDGAPPVLRAA